jgi:hypothetical protein
MLSQVRHVGAGYARLVQVRPLLNRLGQVRLG